MMEVSAVFLFRRGGIGWLRRHCCCHGPSSNHRHLSEVCVNATSRSQGRSFNALGSGITDNIVVRPVRVVQGATSSSLRRVVQDVGQLTSVRLVAQGGSCLRSGPCRPLSQQASMQYDARSGAQSQA